LPVIERTDKFGEVKGGEKLENGFMTFPYWNSSEIVDKTFDVIDELNLNPIFDWTSWKEGKSILNDNHFNYSELDSITLCKLFTTIIRADRFNDGFMISCFENGIFSKIIKGLQKNIIGNNHTFQIKSVLFGVAVGDALGVPVEFNNRQVIRKNPVTEMIGYGTYNLPPGTFSDDSSLTFCLAEALTTEFDLNTIGQNFVKWFYNNYWTPRGNVFDIGIATRQAIDRLAKGERPDLAGGFEASSNGNGSLMRISPLLFYLLDKPIAERYEITKQVSSITHGHIRSVIACFYYLEFARQLFERKDKFEIYRNLQTEVTNHLTSLSINPTEVVLFDRLLKQDIHGLTDENIFSSGYVLHTLEASILWDKTGQLGSKKIRIHQWLMENRFPLVINTNPNYKPSKELAIFKTTKYLTVNDESLLEKLRKMTIQERHVYLDTPSQDDIDEINDYLKDYRSLSTQ
jgi:ADP-ribosylglycohydrolase